MKIKDYRTIAIALLLAAFSVACGSNGQEPTSSARQGSDNFDPDTVDFLLTQDFVRSVVEDFSQMSGASDRIWRYSYVQWNPAAGPESILENNRSPMIKDKNWYDSSKIVYAKSDDTNPVLAEDSLVHNYESANFEFVPVIEFLKPEFIDVNQLQIDGHFVVKWTGSKAGKLTGSDTEVQLLIAKQSSSGEIELLFDERLFKPNPDQSFVENAIVSVSINTSLNVGESILITGLSLEEWSDHVKEGGRWIKIYDKLRFKF